MVEVQQLLNLSDFNELDEVALLDIAEHAGVSEHKKSQRLLADEIMEDEIYLLDGEIEIQGTGGTGHAFTSGSERAQHPIFRIHTPGLYGKCKTSCKVLYVNKSYIEKYGIHKRRNIEDIAVEELDTLAGVETKLSIVGEILDHFKGDKVKLPSLPEIAIHINSMLEQDDVSFKKLAGVIQTDPAIAARVVQVANAAIYGGSKVNSIQGAITKIGIKSIQSIVLCVVMRELFTPENALVRKYMARFYEHSIRVGVICYDLAKRIKGFDADHGFLIGLLHCVGTIPILVIADKHPELAHQAGNMDKTLLQLKSHIGAILLKQWQFDDEYAYTAQHAYDWQRIGDEPDYCDLVQVALLHEQFVGGDKHPTAPPLSELPAFKRLGLDEVDPANEIRLLNEISIRIKDMIKLLCN